MNLKTISEFFLLTLYKHKIKTTLLIFYSIFVGNYIPSQVSLIKENSFNSQLLLILILFIELSFDYIKDLVLFPIYNQSINELKQKKTQQQLMFLTSINIISQFQRTSSIKYVFRNFFSFIKEFSILLSSFFLFYQNKLLFFLLFLSTLFYLMFYLFLQKKLIFLRNEAWNVSEESSKIISKSMQQFFEIKQNLFSKKSAIDSLEKEKESWSSYYFYSNFYFISLTLISIEIISIGFFFKQILLIIIFTKNLERLTKTLKNFYISLADINIFFEEIPFSIQENNYTNKLEIKNLFIPLKGKTLGPFNFIKNKKITIINGENGSGKTSLALAIANLITYEGIIKKPKTLYINLETNLIEEKIIKSKGEQAMHIIDLALKHIAQLIIIDELLDILSSASLIKVLKLIKKSDKEFIIITHLSNSNKSIFSVLNNEFESINLLANFKLKNINQL